MKKFLTVFMAMTIIACTALFATGCGGISSDWTKVKSNLEEEGFSTSYATTESGIERYVEEFGLSVDGSKVDCVMLAVKGRQTLILAFCKDVETAKDIKTQGEDIISDFASAIGVEKDKIVIGRDGTVAYLGHKEAVKAAK